MSAKSALREVKELIISYLSEERPSPVIIVHLKRAIPTRRASCPLAVERMSAQPPPVTTRRRWSQGERIAIACTMWLGLPMLAGGTALTLTLTLTLTTWIGLPRILSRQREAFHASQRQNV